MASTYTVTQATTMLRNFQNLNEKEEKQIRQVGYGLHPDHGFYYILVYLEEIYNVFEHGFTGDNGIKVRIVEGFDFVFTLQAACEFLERNVGLGNIHNNSHVKSSFGECGFYMDIKITLKDSTEITFRVFRDNNNVLQSIALGTRT